MYALRALVGLLRASLIGLFAFGLISCSSPRTAFDQKMQQSNFAFVMAWGSGWHGFSVLRVSGSGEASLLYGEEDDRWLVPFVVPPEDLAALRAELDQIGYWALAPRFSSGAMDGTQWFVKARDGSKRHAVYLDNSFPPQIEDLNDFVKRKIVSRALEVKSQGRPVDYEQWKEHEPRTANDTP